MICCLSLYQVSNVANLKTNTIMKKQILKKLNKISKLAEIGIEGQLTLSFSGVSVSEWDSIIESITEYPRYNHNIEINNKLNVFLILE
jgi:hypothetical protein